MTTFISVYNILHKSKQNGIITPIQDLSRSPWYYTTAVITVNVSDKGIL